MYRWLASLAILCTAFQLNATTVVTIVSSHGIVVCADGKSTFVENYGGPRPRIPKAITSKKVFVIQNRFVVAHGGWSSIEVRPNKGEAPIKIPYSLDHMISDLQREASPIFTAASISNLIRNKLESQFAGFDWLPKSGSLRREMLPPPGDVITMFTIAAYDGGSPHVYEVAVDMDWAALIHRVPPPRTLYPGQRKNLSLFIMGHNDAIMELPNQQLVASRRFSTDFPLEYDALANDRDLDISHMVILGRALVALEIVRSPNDVGYPLTVAMITNSGVTTQTYDK